MTGKAKKLTLTIEQWQLVEDNLPLPEWVMTKWFRGVTRSIRVELRDVAFDGLLRAAHYWKPGKTKFSYFGSILIRQTCTRFLDGVARRKEFSNYRFRDQSRPDSNNIDVFPDKPQVEPEPVESYWVKELAVLETYLQELEPVERAVLVETKVGNIPYKDVAARHRLSDRELIRVLRRSVGKMRRKFGLPTRFHPRTTAGV